MLTLSAPRTSWGSKGSFTMWKSSYRSSICGRGRGQRSEAGCKAGIEYGSIEGIRLGASQGQRLHRVTGMSASEVRDPCAGPPVPQGQRYPGQPCHSPPVPN